jgi:hypothetical protein
MGRLHFSIVYGLAPQVAWPSSKQSQNELGFWNGLLHDNSITLSARYGRVTRTRQAHSWTPRVTCCRFIFSSRILPLDFFQTYGDSTTLVPAAYFVQYVKECQTETCVVWQPKIAGQINWLCTSTSNRTALGVLRLGVTKLKLTGSVISQLEERKRDPLVLKRTCWAWSC